MIAGRMYSEAMASGVVEVLLENHRAFLRFLEHRLGDKDLAEDVLQDAFAKLLAKPDVAPEGEAVVPWFYRLLRNAVIDRYRRTVTATKALESFAKELERSEAAPPADVESEICACVSRLAETLKPEYSEAIQQIDVAGVSVKSFAEAHGLSASNAGVRVFRARDALKKRVAESCGTCATHGCLNCSCERTA
jgi:RNA polymerase sigma factor (sigma-70 family)